MENLSKSSSEINYIPVTLKNGDLENINIAYDEETKRVEMMIDLGDEKLVDFLLNNTNNIKWIKIWEVMYVNKIEMDMFETILFDYIFNKGYTIRKISAITGNGISYTYELRKKLLDKIRAAVSK
jgi:phage antirepressor YoqD-like protein